MKSISASIKRSSATVLKLLAYIVKASVCNFHTTNDGNEFSQSSPPSIDSLLTTYSVSQKTFTHLSFSVNFPLWLKIFNQNFTRPLHVHMYVTTQIQLSRHVIPF